jgi:hypothetical protein
MLARCFWPAAQPGHDDAEDSSARLDEGLQPAQCGVPLLADQVERSPRFLDLRRIDGLGMPAVRQQALRFETLDDDFQMDVFPAGISDRAAGAAPA